MTVSEKIEDRASIKARFKIMPLDYLMQVLNEEPAAPELPPSDAGSDEIEKYAREYAKYFAAHQEVRMQAAIAAAPYLHARLSAIEVKQDAPFVQEVRFTVIEGMAREVARELDDETVRRFQIQ